MEDDLPFTGRTAQVYRALAASLPPVTLLLGDHFLEYGALLGALQKHYQYGQADWLRLSMPVTAAAARKVAAHVDAAPFGPFKLVTVVMDEASEQAQNILLKVLEEPPGTSRFILMASMPPLETIMSRAQVFRFGVQLRQEEADSEAQGKVSAAVRAAMAHDAPLLLAICEGFQARHLAMLGRWAQSQAVRLRPELYGPHGAGIEPIEPEADPRKARMVLQALASVERARPANAAITALVRAFD